MRSAARLIAASKPAAMFDVHPVRAFAYAQEHRLTALMVALTEGKRHHIWFEDGSPVVVEISDETLSLREALLSIDGVDGVAVDMLAAMAATESSLAEELVTAGAVDAAAVAAAQRAQLEARLDYLLSLDGSTKFRVYRANKYDDDAKPIPPSLVFMRAARIKANFPMVDGYVRRLRDAQLRIQSGVDLEMSAFSRTELDIARALRERPATVEQLVETGAPQRDVHGVVFALSMAGKLRRVSAASPMSMPPQSSPGGRAWRSVSDPSIERVGSDSQPGGRPSTAPKRQSSRQRRDSKIGVDSFSEAERAVGMSNFVGAASAIAKALSVEPDNNSYRALAAYVQAARSPDNKGVEAALETIDAIVEADEDNPSAHYYRARILKRMKRADEARAAFKRAAELDPTNVHAASEAVRRRRHTH